MDLPGYQPLDHQPLIAGRAQVALAPGLTALSQDRKKILVVGFDRAQRNIIVACLAEAGYDVVQVSYGTQAIEVVQQERPDGLLLLEWKLPDLSGLAVIRLVREDPYGERLPILVWNTGLRDEEVLFGLDAGADLCLVEPIYPNVLIARLRALLRRCKV